MAKIVRKFLSDKNGATAIEYGLIAALLAVAIVSTLRVLQQGLNYLFLNVNADL